jgi:cytochrome P450
VISVALEIVNVRLGKVLALPDWLPTPENRRLARTAKRLDETIQRFIDERRATGEDRGDLLSMLLLAQDEEGGQMTDKQVRDEAMTLFGAGHETTAVTMMWVWYLLSQHPEVEAKLMRELDSVLGGRAPQIEDLPNLPYTEMVIKETLRLYPPAFGVTRQTVQDAEIGGYRIKKGSAVYVNIYGVQRDARFFPDPDRFDPQRFSPENEKQIMKYAYLPFGGGPRVCIGNAFAMMEARLILATVAQKYRLSVAPGHQVVPDRLFTLRPKYGLKMVATKREPALEMA